MISLWRRVNGLIKSWRNNSKIVILNLHRNCAYKFTSVTSAAVDLYADDTIFYDFQTNIDQLQSNLQLTLNSLQDWCRQNGMVINTEKTKVMLITTRQKRQRLHKSVLSLCYSDIDIRMSTCDKILGVYVDENLQWNDQFHHISKKLASYLWLLSKIRSYLSPSHRLLFYNAYIKPHIEYCSII